LCGGCGWWNEAVECSLFHAQVGVEVGLGGGGGFVAEPERDGGDVDSGVSIRIAVVWRSVCGVTFLPASVAHVMDAVFVWTRILAAIASVLIGVVWPWAVKTGLWGWCEGFSVVHRRSVAAVVRSSGVIRSLRPLPCYAEDRVMPMFP
jgi:hypothetical protein